MNRRTWVVAVVWAGLGVVIGGAAVYLWKTAPTAGRGDATRPSLASRAVVFGEEPFDGKELLARAKPKDAKFVVEGGGERGLTRYGYDGCVSAVWEGPTRPESVKEVIFKDLEARFEAKGWKASRGSSGANLSPDHSIAWYDLRYSSPDDLTAGWVRLFIHQEGQRVGVVLVFNTGRDWGQE
jgi:hypothetical protein